MTGIRDSYFSVLSSVFLHLGWVAAISLSIETKNSQVPTQVKFFISTSPDFSSKNLPRKLQGKPTKKLVIPPPSFPVSRTTARVPIQSTTSISDQDSHSPTSNAAPSRTDGQGSSEVGTPVDDYLISQMPELDAEVRIPYPQEAKLKGIQGVVVMNLLIDQYGVVRTADLIEGPGFGLNEAALAAVLKFRFKPATMNSQPVVARIRYGYRFILEK